MLRLAAAEFSRFKVYFLMAACGHIEPVVKSAELDVQAIRGVFSDEQAEFARGLYDQSISRYQEFQAKAAGLQQNVSVLLPFCLALVAYWEDRGGSRWLVVLAMYGACSSFLAYLAAFRARRVHQLQGFGVSALIDQSGMKVIDQRDPKGTIDNRARLYLGCAIENWDVCDRVGSLVKASEYFVRVTMAALFGAAIVAVNALA